MFEWPRKAFMPPPAMPILPSNSCTMAPVRMVCAPVEWCVQPSAYRMVPARPGTAVEASASATLWNLSADTPHVRSTISVV